MLIDLQLHSTYSDGYSSPSDLVKFIAKNKIKVAALTDHNTTAGLDEFILACKKYGIKSIKGLELYCRYKGKKINILWYNFDNKNEKLLKILEETRKRRALLVKRSLLKLKRRGFRINVDTLLSEFKNYIPINHLTDKIVENKFNYQKILKEVKKKNKYAKLLREEEIMRVLFFDKKENYLSEAYIDIERIVKIKKEVRGQLIFCHPGKYNKYANNMTLKLKNIGVDGLEVLSPHHTVGSILYAQFLAESLDMIASGGSDFHRFEEGENYKLTNCNNWFTIDSKYLRRINEIISN